MSVTPSSPVVGVFSDQSVAEGAVVALYNAGFAHERVWYSTPGNSGGFFDDLKRFFTGTSPDAGSFADDLTNMGLSDEESHYYSDEYGRGNTILIVQAHGREQEALNILQQYGASNSQSMLRDTTNPALQATGYPQEGSYGTMESQPQYGTVEHSYQDQGQTAATPESDTESAAANEITQPAPSGYYSEVNENTGADQATSEVENQPSEANVDASDADAESAPVQVYSVVTEQETDFSTPEADVTAPEQESDSQYGAPGADGNAASSWTARPEVAAPEAQVAEQTTQADTSAPEYTGEEWSPQTDSSAPVPDTQSAPAAAVTPASTDELQQLQEQLRATRQRLEEVKAQLQAAKERETQLRTAREREQQFQSTRQQLQDAQSELEAALAELQDTQARLSQYE